MKFPPISAGAGALALMAALVTVPGTAPVAEEGARVFFMLPNSTTVRFERRDAPLYVAAMKERMPSAEVIVQNGQGDPARQQRLVEDAVAQDADLLVYASSDASLAAGSLKAAADADVPVVLYEHDAVGGPATAHVLFDAYAVGRAQGKRVAAVIEGMDEGAVRVARVKGQQGEYGTIQYEKGQDEYLKPLVHSGRVEVVCEDYIANWDPVGGQRFAEDCLTRYGGDVDVFLTMNDGLGGGIVAALISQGYAPGDIVVTGGQNADLNAVQFIVQGWMDNTVYKDLRVMAASAADVSVAVLNGDPLPEKWINGTVNNQHMDVPAALLPVENVTIDNVAMVMEQGVWRWEQACEGASGAPLCEGR